ncbi:hypothetical protein GCM10010399_90320 [Dactylosporangium fulvum]|uniref:Uncharacterized protein n=1 Tax=Dactylosporangium fulvum TaxID=53359 RepID=A0ABY5WCJ8_9ACTN|nr:hypothetical protein [Dactylosporangium fulvum]UWP87105.1 hypothetical protein Dfulv_23840 [Dactylosporangium fulvum]
MDSAGITAQQAERSDVVGAAYRHDVCSTNRYLVAVQEDPGPWPLRTPVGTVVRVFNEGGHSSVRTRPDAVAAVVTAGLPAAAPPVAVG